jgi:hypothetical protein
MVRIVPAKDAHTGSAGILPALAIARKDDRLTFIGANDAHDQDERCVEAARRDAGAPGNLASERAIDDLCKALV